MDASLPTSQSARMTPTTQPLVGLQSWCVTPKATSVRAKWLAGRLCMRSSTTNLARAEAMGGGYSQPNGSTEGWSTGRWRAKWLERRLVVGASASQMARNEAAPYPARETFRSTEGVPPTSARAISLARRYSTDAAQASSVTGRLLQRRHERIPDIHPQLPPTLAAQHHLGRSRAMRLRQVH